MDGWETISSWCWLSHPIEKYARQLGSFFQVGGESWKNWNHHLAMVVMVSVFMMVIYLWDDGDADGWMINYELSVIYLWEFDVMMVSIQG